MEHQWLIYAPLAIRHLCFEPPTNGDIRAFLYKFGVFILKTTHAAGIAYKYPICGIHIICMTYAHARPNHLPYIRYVDPLTSLLIFP